MGIHYDYKSKRGERAMLKRSRRSIINRQMHGHARVTT